MKQLVIIDCQNDFITGTLACHHALHAIENIVSFLNNNHIDHVFYSQDWHNPTNHSFEVNGGIWPVHCVANTWGAALTDDFNLELQNEVHKPNAENCYLKGVDDVVEEYSAFYAKNQAGNVLFDQLQDEVIICGIASEYCVLETIKELIKQGIKVNALEDGLGFVDPETHAQAMQEYVQLGVELI